MLTFLRPGKSATLATSVLKGVCNLILATYYHPIAMLAANFIMWF